MMIVSRPNLLLKSSKIAGLPSDFGIYYPKPAYMQPAVKKKMMSLPKLKVTEEVCKKCVSIPMFPELTKKEINIIVSVINDY